LTDNAMVDESVCMQAVQTHIKKCHYKNRGHIGLVYNLTY